VASGQRKQKNRGKRSSKSAASRRRGGIRERGGRDPKNKDVGGGRRGSAAQSRKKKRGSFCLYGYIVQRRGGKGRRVLNHKKGQYVGTDLKKERAVAT